jgi:hypothetical protein
MADAGMAGWGLGEDERQKVTMERVLGGVS